MPEKIDFYHNADGDLVNVHVDGNVYDPHTVTPNHLWGLVNKLSSIISGSKNYHVDFYDMYEYGDKLIYTDEDRVNKMCIFLGKVYPFSGEVIIHIQGHANTSIVPMHSLSTIKE